MTNEELAVSYARKHWAGFYHIDDDPAVSHFYDHRGQGGHLVAVWVAVWVDDPAQALPCARETYDDLGAGPYVDADATVHRITVENGITGFLVSAWLAVSDYEVERDLTPANVVAFRPPSDSDHSPIH